MTCECCQFNSVVQGIAALLKTYSVSLPDPKNPKKTPKPQELNPIKTKLLREQAKKKPKKQVINALKALLPKYNHLVEILNDLLPQCQEICLNCSRTSDDDNLSRQGQTFVSIDSMASCGLADSGIDPAAAADLADRENSYDGISDPNEDSQDANFYDDDAETRVTQTAHNYITSHALVQPHVTSNDTSSRLPSHIEDTLKQQLAAFNELDVFEKILVFSQMSGQTFAEFGTMKWLPTEFSRPQSKQLISQRWAKIVAKFPIAAALQRTAPCRNSRSDLAKHYTVDPYQQSDLNLASSTDAPAPSSFNQLKW